LDSEPCRVEVRWPSGRRQMLEQVDVDQELLFEERDARLP
jgi:hypothetical protein